MLVFWREIIDFERDRGIGEFLTSEHIMIGDEFSKVKAPPCKASKLKHS
jgi:hypothetical protein